MVWDKCQLLALALYYSYVRWYHCGKLEDIYIEPSLYYFLQLHANKQLSQNKKFSENK